MTTRKDLAVHTLIYVLIAYAIGMCAYALWTGTVLAGKNQRWAAHADDPVNYWNWLIFHALIIPVLGGFLWAIRYRRRD